MPKTKYENIITGYELTKVDREQWTEEQGAYLLDATL